MISTIVQCWRSIAPAEVTLDIKVEYFSQISKGLTHVCSCLNQEIKITETKTINQEIKITETRTKFIKSGNQNKMLIRKTKSTIIK